MLCGVTKGFWRPSNSQKVAQSIPIVSMMWTAGYIHHFDVFSVYKVL